MLNKIKTTHTIADIETQIQNGTAKEVKQAGFVVSENDGIKATFFTLWGEVIKKVHSRADTTTDFYFVKGEDKDLFKSHYYV